MACLSFKSVYGATLPVVRMIVTPVARYRRGAEKLAWRKRAGRSKLPSALRFGRAR